MAVDAMGFADRCGATINRRLARLHHAMRSHGAGYRHASRMKMQIVDTSTVRQIMARWKLGCAISLIVMSYPLFSSAKDDHERFLNILITNNDRNAKYSTRTSCYPETAYHVYRYFSRNRGIRVSIDEDLEGLPAATSLWIAMTCHQDDTGVTVSGEVKMRKSNSFNKMSVSISEFEKRVEKHMLRDQLVFSLDEVVAKADLIWTANR
ncbi:hypothetical protein N825_08710 [Skermanella stibiiresistens SB22]|uniref:Uncharacterized protein n=1 Tax=Skermanella stibiiresistens SB22 TaxID=1385369 RepID=W9GZ25_9PROT|nr:hypothetical protein [Skermanella stibiiresistens]EWY39074.1 hypothetical protein N825_08710 [Skermanella stibiiresistens SB22]